MSEQVNYFPRIKNEAGESERNVYGFYIGRIQPGFHGDKLDRIKISIFHCQNDSFIRRNVQ